MLRAGVGCSTGANPGAAAAEATAAALKQAGIRRAQGALVFATTAYGAAFPKILRTVASEAGTRQVAGCSSRGVIACEREIESGGAVSVTIFGGDSVRAARLFVPGLRGRPAEVAREIATAVRPALGGSNLLCLFPDTYNAEPEALLAALGEELPGVAVVGGGATEDGSIGETFQFCGDVVACDSVSGMLLAGEFELNIGASLACTPIGGLHRVTKVRENVVLELDGRNAYEVFAEAAGALAQDQRRALAFVSLGVPLDSSVERVERGRYAVRNIAAASAEHGALVVGYRPALGDRLLFLLRDGARARADLKETLEQLCNSISAPPALGLYFDCAARGFSLYQVADHDSAYIHQYLGRFPMGGFFTGFEIGPQGSCSGLLLYSGVLALVSEKAELARN